MIKRLLNKLAVWEGLVTIPALSFLIIFCAGVIQHINPSAGILPEQYLQEIIYKFSVLIIGSNIVQLGLYFNVMLFFKVGPNQLKLWFNELPTSQKVWLHVVFYALYYMVWGMARL